MNQPLPPYAQPPAPPARRRRGGRIALLGCGGLIGLVILVAVIAAVASSQGPTGSTAGGAVSALASPLATRSASPAALSAADQKFVTGLASALAARGQQSTETPAQTAAVGESVCKARRSGATLAQILAGIKATSAGKLIVRTAEKYLCPAYLPKVLLQLSGSGIQNSAPFLVNSGTVTVKYTYDCAGTWAHRATSSQTLRPAIRRASAPMTSRSPTLSARAVARPPPCTRRTLARSTTLQSTPSATGR